jgi:hypothetical protein
MSKSPKDLVGRYLTLRLTNNVEVKGCVFTYNPEKDLIVLVTSTESDTASFRMVRAPFIASFVLESPSKAPPICRLPPTLDAQATLPCVTRNKSHSTKSLYKELNQRFTAAEKKRNELLMNIQGDTPIAAANIFLEVARIFPTTKWDPDEGCIVTESVVIGPNPTWDKPLVRQVDGATDPKLQERLEAVVKRAL